MNNMSTTIGTIPIVASRTDFMNGYQSAHPDWKKGIKDKFGGIEG